MHASVPASCPSDDELLRSTTGELSSDAAARVEAHVECCRKCRAQLREWTQTLDAYRGQVGGHLGDDATALSRFERALAIEDDSRRVAATALRRRLSSILALAATLILAVLWYSQTEVKLNAETVLARSLDFERRQSAPPGPVAIRRMRASGQLASRTLAAARLLEPSENFEQLSANSELVQEVARRLSAYGFDWRRPLTAAAFSRWRSQAQLRQDRLDFIDEQIITVTTMAGGDIAQAQLTIRSHNFEPVGQSWVFADGLAVELSATETTAPSVRTPTAMAEVGPAAKTEAVREADLDALELDARLAAQRLAPAAVSHLQLRRIGHRIRIEGRASDPTLANRLNAAAPTPGAFDVRIKPAPSTGALVPEPSATFSEWLSTTFSTPQNRAAFRESTIQLSTRLADSGAALVALAERYPSTGERSMSADARRKLDELVSLQYRELASSFESIEQYIAPLTGTIERPLIPKKPTADWRQQALAAQRQTDRLLGSLRALIGKSTSPNEDDFDVVARSILRPALQELAETLAGAVPLNHR
jgi:hypothetical protein